MGKGKGVNCNLDFILRIVELVLLCASITLFMIYGKHDPGLLMNFHHFSVIQACDALCMTGSLYIILLLIMVCLQLIKGEEQDKKFVGVLSVIGAALLISTGIIVCIKAKHSTDNILISGIMAIVGGAALVVDALKDFEVF